TASTVFTIATHGTSDQQVAEVTSRYERADAELRARYESALTRLGQSAGSVDELARNIERRHAALTRVMAQFRGVPGPEPALAPASAAKGQAPRERVLAVRSDQERLVAKAETFAHSRAERLRLAFRLAGLDPQAFAAKSNNAPGLGLGGPLVDANDPKALAA